MVNKFVGSTIYNAAKQAFKKNLNPGKAIKSVKTNVPDTQLKKLDSRLKILEQKRIAANKMLDQTNFEIANPGFTKGKLTFDPARKNVPKKSDLKKKKDDDAIAKEFGVRFKKAGGGMMGRRMGYSEGSNGKIKFDAKKSDLDKSGDLSKYEKARGMAIAKAIAKRKNKKKAI